MTGDRGDAFHSHPNEPDGATVLLRSVDAAPHRGLTRGTAALLALGSLVASCAAVERPPLASSPATDSSLAAPLPEPIPSLQDSTAASGQEPVPRWHLPRRNARKQPRGALHHPDDRNPLAAPARTIKNALAERGVHYDLDVTLLVQNADQTESGKEFLATTLWELMGDWKLFSSPELGDGYLAWNLFGGAGLNYNADSQSLSVNVGSTSGLNFSDTLDDPVIVDELFWKQRMQDGVVTLIGGKVDMSYHFDTNRVANTSYTQFNAFALVNNLSIPWPVYGGFGGILRTELTGDLYLMAGMGDSSQTSAVAPWTTTDNDSWYQLVEVGATVQVADLGKGIYRLIPWHNELFDENGWGFGISADQELGSESLLAFLRYGLGDDDVTPVEEFYSAGLAYHGPLDQENDVVAVGLAKSNPSAGQRNETLLELYYQHALTPSLLLTPNLQTVWDPAFANDDDTIVVAGVRLTLHL